MRTRLMERQRTRRRIYIRVVVPVVISGLRATCWRGGVAVLLQGISSQRSRVI